MLFFSCSKIISKVESEPASNFIEIQETPKEENEKLGFLYSQQNSGNAQENKSIELERKSTVRPSAKINFLGIFLLFFLFIVTFFSVPLISSLGLTFVAFNEVKKSQEVIDDFKKEKALLNAERYFNAGEKVLVVMGPFYNLIGASNVVERINQMLTFSRNFATAERYALLSELESTKLLKSFMNSDQSIK